MHKHAKKIPLLFPGSEGKRYTKGFLVFNNAILLSAQENTAMIISKHILDRREKETVIDSNVTREPLSYFASEVRRQFDTSEEKSLHGHNNRETSASIPRNNRTSSTDLSRLTAA